MEACSAIESCTAQRCGVRASGPERAPQLLRHVKVTRSTMTFRLECSPAFDYARQGHETEITAEGAHSCSPRLSLGLASEVPLKQHGRVTVATFSLEEDESVVFALRDWPTSAPSQPTASGG